MAGGLLGGASGNDGEDMFFDPASGLTEWELLGALGAVAGLDPDSSHSREGPRPQRAQAASPPSPTRFPPRFFFFNF